MKRKFLFLITVLGVIILTSSGKLLQINTSQIEKPKGDRGKMNLKGDVGSIVETTSKIESSRAGDYNVDIKTTYVFNEKGNKTEFNSYTNNELMEKTDYQYDEKGNKIKEITSGLTDVFKYDANDSLIEWSRFTENKIDFKHIYTYNSNGKLIKDESNDGFLTTYDYDTNGNKTENAYYVWGKALNNKKDLKRRVTYKYDNNKNLIERNEFNPAEPSFNQPERNTQHSYKYDNKGKLIEEMENGVKHQYKYDINGNQIEESAFSANGEVIYKYTYKFEYDNKMNWTKKTKFENGKQSSVFIRNINYGITKPNSLESNIFSLRKLDGSTLNSQFFGNDLIKKRLQNLLGKERYAFMEGNWNIGTPSKFENDILVTTGCMSHFCMETNFIVIIDITQNTFHAGIRDNDKVKTYSENENNKTLWIKQRMQHWAEHGSD